jgi:AcrR family transcriptional regulator
MRATEDLPNARERSRMETRRLLLDAGTHLFAERGIERTRAADISRAAGVAVGTLYLHFDDKEALLREILVQALAELRARLQRVHETPHASVADSVRDLVETMVRLVEEDPALCRLLFSTEIHATAIGAEILGLLTSMQEDRLREGMAEGYFRSDVEPAVAARALVGMQIHVLRWWAQDLARVPREVVIDTLTKVRLSGLHPAQAGRRA